MSAKRVTSFALAAALIVGVLGAFSPTPTYAAVTNQTPMPKQLKTMPPAWGPFAPAFGFRPVVRPVAFRNFGSFRPFFVRVTVMKGQTLNQLALRFGVSVNRLARINRIANPNLIVTGMRLFIPTFRPFARFRNFPMAVY
jgi:hypothetical protein